MTTPPTIGAATATSTAAGTPEPLFDSLPAAQRDAVVLAAAGFVERAGDLWDALVAMPEVDDARPAVEIVTDIALTAALTIPEEETP